MQIIHVDYEVKHKLLLLKQKYGISINDILRIILNIDNPNKSIPPKIRPTEHKKKTKKFPKDKNFSNIQKKLIPHILFYLFINNGTATKKSVETYIYNQFKSIFNHPYFQNPVKNGTPRWKHHIAWAKQQAKLLGYIKSPEESGKGIWSLTEKGFEYCKKLLNGKFDPNKLI